MLINLRIHNSLHPELPLDPRDDNLVLHQSTEKEVGEGHREADNNEHAKVIGDHYLNC